MQTHLAWADYGVIGAFFLVMLAVGVYFSNRMRNLKDFFSGNNRVPWWVSGVSLYMTSFSAFAFVAYSALAYKYGFVAITIWWSAVPCWIISARFFAARWRRAATTSPVEYVETRFGSVLRQGFAWVGIPMMIFDDALKLFVIGKMITVSLGIGQPGMLECSIAACGLIMLAYTFMGGLWAVMVTDFVQFVVMGTAVLVLAPLVLIRLGGPAALVTEVPPGFWFPVGGDYTWLWLGSFALIQMMTYATKWPLVQRYYAVETDADARKVGYLVAALIFFGMPLLFFPGMAARVFMPDLADANAVYPLLCKQLLPVGMVGMMVSAMFSATMSTLSGDYNAVASVMTNDIYKRLLRPHASEKSLLWAGRACTLLVGMIVLAVAMALTGLQGKEDLVNIMAQLFSVLVPPVAIPMMCGLLTRRVSNAGGLGGFLAGAFCGVVAYVVSYAPGGDFEYLRTIQYIPWIASLPTFITMVLLSRFFPDGAAKQDEVRRFLDGLTGQARPRQTLSPEDAAYESNAAVVAIRIIGLASGSMGALLIASVVLTGAMAQGLLSMAVGTAMVVLGGATAVGAALLSPRNTR